MCCIAIAKPKGIIRTVMGICAGRIIQEKKGGNGFGYDPVFFIPELGKTMAELSMAQKNKISHRAHAAEKARAILTDM